MPDGVEIGRIDDALEQDADVLADALLAASPRTGREEPLVPLISPRWYSAGGSPLPAGVRRLFEQRLGIDLSAVRIHTDGAAVAAARGLKARAFTAGVDIVFGKDSYSPHTARGLRLLAHELAHVVQQSSRPATATAAAVTAQVPHAAARDSRKRVIRRKPEDEAPVADVDIGEALPDDEQVDAGIDWPSAEEKNIDWWQRLLLAGVQPVRDLDPILQPRAFANRTIRAQALMLKHGPKAVAGALIDKDGVFGPRTLLGLARVAEDEKHPARAEIQGLGFDLDTIAAAGPSLDRARAFAIRPEFLVQTALDVAGEDAVRYYDQNFHQVSYDRDVLDQLLFLGEPPEGIRRADRIELLRRLYATAGRRLGGTAALIRAKRGFVHTLIDFERAVDRDTRQAVERHTWFAFAAQNFGQLDRLQAALGVADALQKVYKELPEKEAAAADEAIELLGSQRTGPVPVEGPEVAAVLAAVYLPTPDETQRASVVSAYLTEKEERERAQREAIDEHNRGVARQWADSLVALIDRTQVNDEGDPLNNLERLGYYLTYLADYLRQKEFFDLVLDDLRARPGDYFTRLYDDVEALRNNKALSYLTELSLAGRYRSDPRVRQSVAKLGGRVGELLNHAYIVEGDGAVLLGGTDRLEVGQVAGEVNSVYLRDEDRERLKPEAQERLSAELENQGRLFVDRLLRGEEPDRSQEDAAHEILKLAWTAAQIDPDKDIEDVVYEESLRLLGVRRGETDANGVARFDVQFEVVQRIVGDDWTTGWEPVKDSGGWHTEHDFEHSLFWYKYSQQEDIIRTMAIVVAVAATLIVAWEIGLLGALVAAGGGAGPVSISILLSLAFYHFTHERHTVHGYLVAIVEGYLAAVGFKLFAPAGAAVGKLILPATLEQVAFRRVVAAWIARHGVTGGLTGATVGPATLLVEDLLRIAAEGGGFSPLEAYVTRAAIGLVFGAVFEIGGSFLLSPIFKVADRTVLSKLSEVIKLVRQENAHITMQQWLAESAVSLSKFRQWLGDTMEPGRAAAVYAAAKKRVADGTAQIWHGAKEGFKVTLQREVLELGSATLTSDAVKGLERLLRLAKGTVDDDAMATLLQHVRAKPERVEPWLRFLAEADDALVTKLVTNQQLRPLADADAALALVGRRSGKEVANLLEQRFGDSIADLDAFATRLNKLENSLADRALDLLRTRGTAVTPRTLLRIAEADAAVDDEVLGGLQRMLDGADAARLEAVLEAMGDDQVGAFLRSARTASVPDLEAMRRVVATHEAPHVAWAVRLPIAEAETLLNQLTAEARTAITDITAAQARDLIAILGDKRVNNALSLGIAGPVRGGHLLILHQRLPLRVVQDILDSAGVNPGGLARVARVSASYDTALARLPAADVEAGTLVLDSNARAGVDELVRGVNKRGDPVNVFADLDENYRTAINAIRHARGLSDYVDPGPGIRPTVEDVVGPGADLRATPIGGAEAVAGEALSGRASSLLPQMRGVTPDRAHADYADVINDMASGDAIGGKTGAMDRTVIADAMFAETATGVTPVFVTVDSNVATRLARRFIVAPRTFTLGGPKPAWTQLVERIPEGRFTIEIRGHRLEIVFHPPTGRLPNPP